MKCPDCGGRAEAEWEKEKRTGLPVSQVGPYECLDCGWIEDDAAPLRHLDVKRYNGHDQDI